MTLRTITRSLGAAGVLCVVVFARRAYALDAEVTSTTAAQGYSLRSPWGDPILNQRRFLQTLGLSISNLEGTDTDKNSVQVTFRMRMRFDGNFAIGSDQTSYQPNSGTFIPGLQNNTVDLMYGYFDIRNIAHGMVSARLGRQYVIDSLGWWSFDGALARVVLPIYLGIDAYGGLEQRGGLPVSNPRFERDGVWRGDRSGMDATSYPAFQQAHIAPACGATIETVGLPFLHARVAYRKVWNTGDVAILPMMISQLGASTLSGTRTSSERIGMSVDALAEKVGGARLGAIYDIYGGLLSSWYASVDAFAARSLTIGADIDRVVPMFDADSIWNWFVHNPMTTATVRAEWALGKHLDLAGSAGMRWYETSAQSDGLPAGSITDPGGTYDALGRLSGRFRWKSGLVGCSGLVESGQRGHRDGGDAWTEHTIDGRFLVSARVSLYDWRDALRADQSTLSFSYVLGAGYRIANLSRLLVEWEQDSNQLVGQRYRLMAMMQLGVMK